MLSEFCFWSSWLPYFSWLVNWAVSCFPKTQQGYTCGVDVGLVWCLGRRQGALHRWVLQGFPILQRYMWELGWLVVVGRVIFFFFLFSSEGLFPTTSFSKGEESQPRAKSLSFLSWFYWSWGKGFVNKQQGKCSLCWCPVLLNICVYSVSHHWAELKCKGTVEVWGKEPQSAGLLLPLFSTSCLDISFCETLVKKFSRARPD